MIPKVDYKIFAENVELPAMQQIEAMINDPHFKNETFRFMPDVHAGSGCVIGTVMTYSDKVVPNWVGVDISCGVYTVKLSKKMKKVDLEKLDDFIVENVPSEFDVRIKSHKNSKNINLEDLKCWIDDVDIEKIAEKNISRMYEIIDE